MNIDLELYKIFYHVAKNKNISKTANELHISQPAISKSIKNLESQLDCSLFVRRKYGVELTKEGLVFYNKIKDAFSIIKSAESSLENMINLDEGTLTIGSSNTITKMFLLPYLKEFHEEFPNIKINIISNSTKNNINNLKNGIIDLLILNLPYQLSGEFNIFSICNLHDVFVANKDFEFLKDKEISLNELSEYPLILIAEGSSTRFFLDSYSSSKGVVLKPFSEPTSFSLVVEFAKLGLGIGYVTKEYLNIYDNLFEIKLKEKIPARSLGVATLKNQKISHAASQFLEIIKENNIK